MFRMNLPNQSAEEQRKEVRRQVRNNVFSFIGLVALIRTGSLKLTCGTYSSAADASTAVKIYFHRRRENQAKLLQLTNQNRFNDEENQEND
ncbi:unnamed protein product [Chironomus riparius]|uniref:Uncharacterized protein n=1 Tax=Chironomus riparius TaxID=315576 RepID=A0A9N9RUR9_9DIPT|nr:unnamed protein product [Chironomus riparius]